ncbi:hypothetical protein BEL05_02510 [Shewanella colwelliana]|uniref:Uncharacterized protein n=1 Tax=Shewanella colwelliana TaxID=23 RepID=A0A1E5IYC5_SHECO|nr:hypothetical protein [Shewanella colwelliana]OEG75148.1 hypothetical protein BEL05_02510 [Shewanella colwelliana]
MSGNNGSYLFIANLIGIRASLATSVKVNEEMSGTLRSKHERWMRLTNNEKATFLAEEHEFAHHQLMTSSLAGVLYWRLSEVWSRDVSWLSQELARFGLFPERGLNLWEWWKKAGQKAARSTATFGAVRLAYLNHVFEHLNLIADLRDYLYGNEIPNTNITRSTFAKMLSVAFDWCAERSGLSIGGSHDDYLIKTKNCATIVTLQPDAPVFPTKEPYNLQSLFEAYSVFRELFVLQLVGDDIRAQDLLEKTLAGQYGEALRAVIPLAESSDWKLGFSPHIAMQHILLMCNTPIDIVAYKEENQLEDILPWLGLHDSFCHHGIKLDKLIVITEQVHTAVCVPLFSDKANWLRYLNLTSIKSLEDYWATTDQKRINNFTVAITSNAVNQAAFTFKANLSSTCKLLMHWASAPEELDRREHFQSWFDDTKKSICLVEYIDAVYIATEPVIKANDKPFLKPLITTLPIWVIFGLLLRAHEYYMLRSYWDGTCRPSLTILIEKLESLFSKEIGEKQGSYCDFLTEFTSQLERQAKTRYPNTLVVNDFNLYCDQ